MKILFIILMYLTAFCASEDACEGIGDRCHGLTQRCCDPYLCEAQPFKWGVCIEVEATTKSSSVGALTQVDLARIFSGDKLN